MAGHSWMYDIIIYIYALSLLFYFSDFVGQNQSAKRMGTGLLTFVWVLQTLFFIIRMIEHRYMPVLTQFEVAFFLSWLLVTASLVINRFFRIDLIVFFVNVIGFAILTLNVFSNPTVAVPLQPWQVADELLIIHSSLAVMSYAVLTLAAVFSGMYLFLHYKLKHEKWSTTIRRFPSLEKIGLYIYLSVVTGIPLLIMAIALGIARIFLVGDLTMLLDMKVWTSVIVLGAYAYYLLKRITSNISGDQLALLNLASFGVIILNLLINYLSGFHKWIWE